MLSYFQNHVLLFFSSVLISQSSSVCINNPGEVPLYNDLAHQRYNINVAVGTPPQQFPLLFDTASSDVWFPKPNSSGCAPNCPPGFEPSTSSSIIDIKVPYDARYGLTPDLAVIGSYFNDSIAVSGFPTISDAQFAVANVPPLFFSQGNWGIVGAGSRVGEVVFSGPTSPYRGNYSATYTPLWEVLALALPSGKRKFSVWLNAQESKTGSVQFGGSDKSKFEGELVKIPVNTQNSVLGGWSVNVTGVARVVVGEGGKETKTQLTEEGYSVDYTIDTGSPNMYIPISLYNATVVGLNATSMINGAPYVPCAFRSSTTGFLIFDFATQKKDREVQIRVPYSEIIYPFGYPVTVPPFKDENGVKMCYFGIVPTDGPIRLLGATLARSAYLVFNAEDLEIEMAQAKWTSEST